jgi:hypothetical protein
MAAQQLCYADQLVVRPLVVPRCAAITAQLALYYLGLESATTQQNEWAKNAILSAQSIGEQVSWHVLNQDAFKDNGSAIDDATLKGIVETAIQNHFIAPAP